MAIGERMENDYMSIIKYIEYSFNYKDKHTKNLHKCGGIKL
ncbi:hypothetical protein QY95_00893 [Bacillus thermotolerans]|uniref:Uncharacterized protein n=1 Tax=Bacillus thermotolerans TaxID=1221996 RepID=A0A0F5I6N9_BACTR|nr:hypothetical protein QY95_00893 [Bacillus thermotolerans]